MCEVRDWWSWYIRSSSSSGPLPPPISSRKCRSYPSNLVSFKTIAWRKMYEWRKDRQASGYSKDVLSRIIPGGMRWTSLHVHVARIAFPSQVPRTVLSWADSLGAGQRQRYRSSRNLTIRWRQWRRHRWQRRRGGYNAESIDFPRCESLNGGSERARFFRKDGRPSVVGWYPVAGNAITRGPERCRDE